MEEENKKDTLENLIIEIFNLLNCKILNIEELNGVILERDILIDTEIYSELKYVIPQIRNFISSSSLTCLHNEPEKNQKWPLINLVRQILKLKNYNLEPKRVSAGYLIGGKKKYKRLFIIKKNKIM